MNHRNLLLLALVLSLAFNLGFVISIAVHRYMRAPEVEAPFPEPEGCPHRLRLLSDQLTDQLEPLRSDQAGLTRRLAELIAAPETDRDEIDRCLDQLSDTGRQVQGAVVNAILTQKEELPEGERAEFCLEVHRCLCESWSRSGFKSDCCPAGCAKKDKTETEGQKE
jgi:hypothetical protein